ncbi:OLC1v1024512C1 [Oldenlandia corymbosa var. corymbosa]|uniref:OLC1v1024512C1 n=1 Tax=Oldenlandia corymbosa var. corymbosa TaxID=529605 RepID=A0AAV1C5J7_OLDCO|nr:OLC1v1024512C1 [Oldenlandia corymbosa var. corymbosa]
MPYAVRCILDDGRKVEDYVDRWYSKEMYLRAYANSIRGLNCPKFWKWISDPPLLPLEFRPMPGRVKSSRNKRHDEPHRVYMNQKGWYKASGKVGPGHSKCGNCQGMGHSRKSSPDLKQNDGKESKRPLGGQKRAAPKQRGKPRKRVVVEPLANDTGKQKGRGRKALPNNQYQYCKRRGHKPKSCPALKMRLEKKKEAAKQEKVPDGDKNDPVVLVSRSKEKGKKQVLDGDENDPVVLVSRSKEKGKNQVLDGDENYPVVLVSKSKEKGKFHLRDEDENDPGIPVSITKRKEIQILVEDDVEDFPVIRVPRTRRKGKFQILDEYVGEDVPVTTTVDGEAENVVPDAEALPCEYCQMTSHRRVKCPEEQLTRWIANETSDEEHDNAADSALEPRADCSGNLDMDERKDQNEESLKVITAPDELAVETLNLVRDDFEQTYSFWDQCSGSGWNCDTVMGSFNMESGRSKATKNNRQPEDVGNSVIAPVVESQPHEDPNKASPAMEMLSKLSPTRKKMGRCSKVSEENLGPTTPSLRRFSSRLRGRLLWTQSPVGGAGSSATSPIDIGLQEEDQARNDQSHAFDFVVLDVTVIEKQMTSGQGERIRDKTWSTTLTIALNWVLVGHARLRYQMVNLLGRISNYPFPNLTRNPNSNKHANGAGHSGKNSTQKPANHLALARYLQDDLVPVPHADDRAEIPVLAVPHAEVAVDPLQSHNPQDRFVYPPMAVVVNLPRKLDCGKFVGLSGRVLREKYLFEGFNPTKVEPLWNDETGHSRIGIAHFRSGFDGLTDAHAFH